MSKSRAHIRRSPLRHYGSIYIRDGRRRSRSTHRLQVSTRLSCIILLRVLNHTRTTRVPITTARITAGFFVEKNYYVTKVVYARLTGFQIIYTRKLFASHSPSCNTLDLTLRLGCVHRNVFNGEKRWASVPGGNNLRTVHFGRYSCVYVPYTVLSCKSGLGRRPIFVRF